MSDLREALGEAPDEDAVPVQEEAPAVEPVAEEPAPAEQEAKAEKPAEAEDEPKMVPLTAVQQERQRRQELERRLQELESKREPEAVPDVLDDPEGYARHIGKSTDEKTMAAKLDLSEDMARMHYGDELVEAAQEAFKAHLGTAKHQEILTSRNPYKALVEWHKQQSVISEIGDPEKWREAERARIKAEVEAEMAVKQVRATPEAPSLAADSNLGARKGPAWGGPTPLEDALK